MSEPVRIFVRKNKGYVWSADEALRLRDEYSIVGMSIGGLTEFRSQNQILGLPLELSMEEVSFLLSKGWARTVRYNPPKPTQDASAAGPAAKKQKQSDFDDFGYGDYDQDQDYDQDGGDYFADAQAEEAPPAQLQQAQQQPLWKQWVHEKTKVTIPLVPEDLWDNLQDEPWPYPTTRSDLHRVAVFTDLHDLGYVLTDGVKFGGDFLAYPGDPMLYHAQFVIRVLEQGRPILPCILAAHSRTSHGARKHMVIASVSAEEGEQTRGAAGAAGGASTSTAAAAAIRPRQSQLQQASSALDPFLRQNDDTATAEDEDEERCKIVGVEPRSRSKRTISVKGTRFAIRYLTTSPDAGFGRDRDKDEFQQPGTATGKKAKAGVETGAEDAGETAEQEAGGVEDEAAAEGEEGEGEDI